MADAGGPQATVEDQSAMPAPVNVTLLELDFVVTMAGPSYAEFDVPAGAAGGTRLWVWFEMNQGVWQGLQLSGLPDECLDHTVSRGLAVGAGTNNGSGGSTCVAAPGPYRLEWTLDAGAVQGVVTVHAEVPA